jgi:hypothetical protein
MATPVIEIPQSTAAPKQTHLTQNASRDRAIDKLSDTARAKKKKKRDAHRVALRRSHTKG